jgi:hypothetical protein
MKNIISFSLFESHATLKPGASVEFRHPNYHKLHHGEIVELYDRLVVIKDDKDGELVTIRRSDLGPMYEN